MELLDIVSLAGQISENNCEITPQTWQQKNWKTEELQVHATAAPLYPQGINVCDPAVDVHANTLALIFISCGTLQK